MVKETCNIWWYTLPVYAHLTKLLAVNLEHELYEQVAQHSNAKDRSTRFEPSCSLSSEVLQLRPIVAPSHCRHSSHEGSQTNKCRQ